MSDLPDPKLMAPLKAVPIDDALNDWLVAYQTGNSGVDGKDWAIVTDRVNASAFYYLTFPGDAKEDAEAIVAILMAYRSGKLVEAEPLLALLAEAREALALIAIVDQGCGGNLSFKEMAESAMRQAVATLSRIDDALAAEPEARG